MRAEGRPEGIDWISLIIDNHWPAKKTKGEMRVLSKSRLLVYRQCPKRLWL